MNFLLYISFVTFMPRKIRWKFPALFYFLEEREDFLFVFCLFCVFFLHSITCNSHCATVIDSLFVSTFSNKIWPFFLHQFRKF